MNRFLAQTAARHRATILLGIGALTMACGSSVTDGGSSATGGTGSTGGGGVGGGGGGAGNTPSVCPDAPPVVGDPCTSGLVCDYEVVPASCAEAMPATARCLDAHWSMEAPASCGPLTAPSCQPVGEWSLAYEGLENCHPPPSVLRVTQSDEGIVYVADATSASLSADGCELGASWSDVSGGDWGFVDQLFAVSLDFSLAPPSGAASYTCVGECGCSDTEGTVTAAPAAR